MHVQRGEHNGRRRPPVVVRPSPHDRVDLREDCRRVRAAQGAELDGEAVPDSFDGGFAGFDDQLAVVTAGGEPEEVEPVVEVDDARLVLVEGQSSGRQPCGEPRFDVFGLLPGVAEGDHVVGVSNQ
jgi:hypothetical protein